MGLHNTNCFHSFGSVCKGAIHVTVLKAALSATTNSVHKGTWMEFCAVVSDQDIFLKDEDDDLVAERNFTALRMKYLGVP